MTVRLAMELELDGASRKELETLRREIARTDPAALGEATRQAEASLKGILELAAASIRYQLVEWGACQRAGDRPGRFGSPDSLQPAERRGSRYRDGSLELQDRAGAGRPG
ncbi:MAG: hypothetical protein IPP07_08850 [Holophagales bacterium]|nr:hypothetical protein [Holophagales bacterium]